MTSGTTNSQYNGPSIMYSLTISQSCFMWNSERYLQFFAASSHSSGPAERFRRAGPGWGTFIGAIVREEESQQRAHWRSAPICEMGAWYGGRRNADTRSE